MTRAEVVCRVAVSLTKSNPHQYYFAESLIDLQKAEGGKVAPIGIVNTAIGGTMICDWTDNVTTATCNDPSIGETPQGLWDSKVLPFVDLTVKGWLCEPLQPSFMYSARG